MQQVKDKDTQPSSGVPTSPFPDDGSSGITVSDSQPTTTTNTAATTPLSIAAVAPPSAASRPSAARADVIVSTSPDHHADHDSGYGSSNSGSSNSNSSSRSGGSDSSGTTREPRVGDVSYLGHDGVLGATVSFDSDDRHAGGGGRGVADHMGRGEEDGAMAHSVLRWLEETVNEGK